MKKNNGPLDYYTVLARKKPPKGYKKIRPFVSYSSYQPFSVSLWHAHSRALVFHTLHRGHRDTILCLLISYRLLLCNRYICSVPRVLLYFPSFTLLLRPLLLSPLPVPALPPGQAPPGTTTTSLLAPPVPFPTHHTGLTVIA